MLGYPPRPRPAAAAGEGGSSAPVTVFWVRMRKAHVLVSLCIALLPSTPPAWGAGGPGPGNRGVAEVRVAEGRVTIQAESAPLTDLLREISRQAGVPIVLLGRSDQVVTGVFRNLPVDAAIRALILRANTSWALVYEEDLGGARRLLKAGVIFRRGAIPGQESAGEADQVHQANLRGGSIEEFLQSVVVLYPDARTPLAGVYKAVGHPDPSVRVNALSVLAELGSGDQARRALEEAANDPDPMVHELARRMLFGKPSDEDEDAGASVAGSATGR